MHEVALPAAVPDTDDASAGITGRGATRATVVSLGAISCAAFLIATTGLPISSPRVWIATLIILVCAIPAVVFAARPERCYPLLALIGIGYALGFGVPAFHSEFLDLTWVDPLLESDYVYASWMILLGCTTLVVGMLVPMHRVVTSKTLRWPSDDKLLGSRFAIAAFIGGATRILLTGQSHEVGADVLIPETLFQPMVIVANMLEIGAVVVVALWSRRKTSGWWCLLALAGVVPSLVNGFGSGAIWNVVRPILVFAVAYYGLKRRIPWVPLLVVAILFVPANQAKMEFRFYVEETPVSVLERPLIFAKIIWRNFGQTTNTSMVDDARDAASNRMDHLTLMAQVVSMTPDRIPYWNGKTYEPLLYAPIPRFIMPDKPKKGLGQDFGHRYDFLWDEDYSTSINLAQLIETYANFGPPGVAIGMFLIGVLYAAVSAFFEQKDPPLVAIAVGAAVVVQLINIESDFGLVNGGLIASLPALWLAVHAMCWRVPDQSEEAQPS
jgi:hypothetical protein